MKKKILTLAWVATVVLGLDIWTKRWALQDLPGNSIELLGGWIPLTLAFNRGAAFGIEIGNDPRLFFVPVAFLALILLTTLLIRADRNDGLRIYSVVLVMSGAVGNLIDRLRWDRGVVDFIGPIDLGFMDWPIFNVADMAISCGAVLLAISFWQEEREIMRAQAEGEAAEEAAASPEPASQS